MKITLPREPEFSDVAELARPSVSTESQSRSEYLLVCEAWSTGLTEGYWRFTLETADGELILDADDHEWGDLNRLTLLAAVRGLESIEGPGCVTLISNNRYLIRSLSDSLPRWSANNFVWDHFGRPIDVQHADLWRRVDGALKIHRVEACLVSSRLVSRGSGRTEPTTHRIDGPHIAPNGSAVPRPMGESSPHDRLRKWLLSAGGKTSSSRRFTSEDLLETA